MALIKCEECGNQISNKAHSCVHCGAPIEKLLSDASVSKDPATSLADEISQSAPNKSVKIANERLYGKIKKINLSVKDGVSLAEVVITQPGGTEISTGIKTSKEIRPYVWRVGDTVSFVVDNWYACDITKESKTISFSSDMKNSRTVLNPTKLLMPKNVEWFERLMFGSVGVGLLFVKIPGQAAGFAFGVATITLLFVLWASRGRSSIAKWLNGISVALGTLMIIPILQEAQMWGNPFYENVVFGNNGALITLQTLMQLFAAYFLFSSESKPWFDVKR
jgi:hypothetical protein|tara:strand:- start:53 stop:886 length:834 start_codon:yes stop_codon:yes gene_type:complete